MLIRHSQPLNRRSVLKSLSYEAPIGVFFCPEIRALAGFGVEISSTVSKVLSVRKVLFKHKKWPLIAGR